MAKSHEELQKLKRQIEAYNNDPKTFTDVQIDTLRKALCGLSNAELLEAVGDMIPPIPSMMRSRQHVEAFNSFDITGKDPDA